MRSAVTTARASTKASSAERGAPTSSPYRDRRRTTPGMHTLHFWEPAASRDRPTSAQEVAGSGSSRRAAKSAAGWVCLTISPNGFHGNVAVDVGRMSAFRFTHRGDAWARASPRSAVRKGRIGDRQSRKPSGSRATGKRTYGANVHRGPRRPSHDNVRVVPGRRAASPGGWMCGMSATPASSRTTPIGHTRRSFDDRARSVVDGPVCGLQTVTRFHPATKGTGTGTSSCGFAELPRPRREGDRPRPRGRQGATLA